MLRRITRLCVGYAERYIPDPYLYAALLTFVTAGAAFFFTDSRATQIIDAWYNGIWTILTFAAQMALILLTGVTLADAPPIRGLLQRLAGLPQRQSTAAILVFLVGAAGSWVNWGFGIVIGGLLAREIAKQLRNVDFGFLVASAYIGFMVWASGLSSSIALATASHGSALNIVERVTGQTIGLSGTIFAAYNLVPVILFIIVMPVFLSFMGPLPEDMKKVDPAILISQDRAQNLSDEEKTFASMLENSWIVTVALVAMGIFYEWHNIRAHGFSLDFNAFIFIGLMLGLIFHGRPIRYVRSFNSAAHTAGPVLLQYPLYGGIMGIISGTGLAALISQSFVNLSSHATLPFWSFISSNIITLFVPSGGGHWAVQGPFMILAAVKLGVSPAMTAMATAMGEQTANMIQPFWALPLLALARLGIKDVMGYCVIALAVGLLLFGGSLLVFA